MDIYEVYLVKRVKINGNFLLGLVYIRNLHKVKKRNLHNNLKPRLLVDKEPGKVLVF